MRRPRNPVDPEKIEFLYLEELKSISYISRLFDVDFSTIRRCLVNQGVDLRSLSAANTIAGQDERLRAGRSARKKGKPGNVKGMTWKINDTSNMRKFGHENNAWRGGVSLDKDYQRAYRRNWKKENTGKVAAYWRASKDRKIIPAWADIEKMNCIYEQARQLGQTVDHIVPVLGATVCGLHCEHNLQLMPRSENARKGNRYWPDMP